MEITLDQIAPLVGQEFIVQTLNGAVALSLAEAVERPRRGLPQEFRTPLSLILDGPADTILEQGNYYIHHPLFGGQQWCIVPIMASSPGVAGMPRYQIVFC